MRNIETLESLAVGGGEEPLFDAITIKTDSRGAIELAAFDIRVISSGTVGNLEQTSSRGCCEPQHRATRFPRIRNRSARGV